MQWWKDLSGIFATMLEKDYGNVCKVQANILKHQVLSSDSGFALWQWLSDQCKASSRLGLERRSPQA